MSSALQRLARAAAPRASISARALHTSPAARLPYKDSQDRESLKPRTAEHTQSGRDEDVAASTDAAFTPGKNDPEAETKAAQQNGNPLSASGANQELSKPQGDEKTPNKSGAGKEVSKGGASGGKSAQKRGEPGRV